MSKMVSQNNVKTNIKRRERVIEALSYVFNELCKLNDPFSTRRERSYCGFSSVHPFPMSIKHYLTWIAYYTSCSNESLIFSLIFIDKLIDKNPSLLVTSWNVQCVVLTSIVVSLKYHDDRVYKSSFYAKVGGISSTNLMKLEMLFLQKMEFNLSIEKSLYRKYFDKISEWAGKTYTFRTKMVSNDLPYIEKGIQFKESAKPLTIAVNLKPRSHSTDHHREFSHKKGTRSQPEIANFPGHCCRKKTCDQKDLQTRDLRMRA